MKNTFISVHMCCYQGGNGHSENPQELSSPVMLAWSGQGYITRLWLQGSSVEPLTLPFLAVGGW